MSVRTSSSSASASSAAASVAADSSSRYESGSSLRKMMYLIGHQIFTRLGTFVLNILVARHIGPVSYGISAVHLYLLNTTILFLTREAIRRATLRYAAPPTLAPLEAVRYERTVLCNLSWLSILLSLPVCVAVYLGFRYYAPMFDATDAKHGLALAMEYDYCIALYTFASFLELLSEPFYLLFQKHQRIQTRVLIDAAAVMARCVVTFLCMKYTDSAGGLRSFAYGQISFALVLILGYLFFTAREIFAFKRAMKKVDQAPIPPVFESFSDLLPQRLPTVAAHEHVDSVVTNYSDASLLRLTTQLTYQSLEKFALTEGEKLVLVSLNSNLDAQGIYGLIQNLGSLIARMIFQPLEESAFMEFSLLFAPITSQRDAIENNKHKQTEEAEPQLSTEFIQGRFESSVKMLGTLLHLVVLLGALLLSFGPAYSYVFLTLIYGAKWSLTSAPSILSLYCVYILFIAVNGLTESFVSAVISTKQLKHYNVFLAVFSVGYVIACIVLLPYQAAGLIFANCFNMSMRIAYSVWFLIRFFQQAPAASSTDSAHAYSLALFQRVAPPPSVLITFTVSFLVTNASFYQLIDATLGTVQVKAFILHIGVGVVCLLGVALSIFKGDRRFLIEMKEIAKNRKKRS